jgi:Fur family ferric uptake transcriptional regulator
MLCFNRRLDNSLAWSSVRPFVPSTATSEVNNVAAQIRSAGARATPARIRVLQLLRAAPAAMTHHDIEAALGGLSLDRVTLYRVLDWLAEAGLAHKSTDARGVFRFSVAAAGEHTAHAHFSCDACGRVFCLDAAPPAPPNLPDGFSLSRMEIDLRGRCAACAGIAA